MTTPQLIGATCAYAVAFIAVVLATRATARRALGALVGGAAAGVFFLGSGLLGMAIGWWQGPLPSTPSLATLFFVFRIRREEIPVEGLTIAAAAPPELGEAPAIAAAPQEPAAKPR